MLWNFNLFYHSSSVQEMNSKHVWLDSRILPHLYSALESCYRMFLGPVHVFWNLELAIIVLNDNANGCKPMIGNLRPPKHW